MTQREKVSRTIREALNERVADFNLVLDDVAITRLDFSREFTQAVEAKLVAQQDAERSKFTVQKDEQVKLAAIIRAEGEAEAARLISNALRDSGSAVIDVRRIDASREIAEILSSSRNVAYVPSTVGMLMAAGGGAGRGQSSAPASAASN